MSTRHRDRLGPGFPVGCPAIGGISGDSAPPKTPAVGGRANRAHLQGGPHDGIVFEMAVLGARVVFPVPGGHDHVYRLSGHGSFLNDLGCNLIYEYDESWITAVIDAANLLVGAFYGDDKGDVDPCLAQLRRVMAA